MQFIYPDSFETKTGFDSIRQRLAAECMGQAGRDYCLESRISTKPGVVNTWLEQVAEYQALLATGKDLLQGTYPDMSLLALRLDLEGSFLLESELHEIRRLLLTIDSVHAFNRTRNPDTYPQLARITANVQSLARPLARLNQVLDENGKMRDSASSELQRIRRAIIEEQRALRRKLESILRQALADGHAPDGAEITIRSGRLVIPVVAESKRRIRGFVHDESATGQTVFLEPADVLDGNNRVRELEYEERREIQRILLDLTNLLREEREGLDTGYETISLLDFIRAKARFAHQTRSIRPQLNRDGLLRLRDARNPVLEEVLQRHERTIVPLDIDLSRENRILVVSGPNAGGKSASLKAVALMQYMAQFGLPIPAREDSTLPVFERFFIDIGDDQSLENDLSTYSSHLTHMRRFLEQANERSLVLIDEFGTGTDPAYGGPIAAAVLEELNRKSVYGFITTHYSSLKDMASSTPGLQNGSMRFDVKRLTPLYQLQVGKPGSSFALEIAEKTGLPSKVLDAARKRVGKVQTDLDKLIVEVETERTEVDRLKRQLSEQKKVTDKLRVEYEQITGYLSENRAGLMRQAKEEAKRLVQEANRRIEQTIRDIREAEADKELTRDLRKELQTFDKELELTTEEAAAPALTSPTNKKTAREAAKKKTEPGPVVIEGTIAEGDSVRIKGTEMPGTVVNLKGNQARVQTGQFTSTVNVGLLEKLDKKSLAKPLGTVVHGVNLNERLAGFSHQLDVRGLYAGDAITQVDDYMDNAILLGAQEVRILHGKGNGILKTQIRNHLRNNYPQVVHLAYDHPDRGGEGITVVTLA